jgi:type I restriction enzyme R subunit
LDQLLPKMLHEPLWQEACWWDQLRKEAAVFYFDEVLAAAPASKKLERLFEEEARMRGPSRIREGASLYGQDFWQELESFETLTAKNLRLLHVLYHETRRAVPADPVYYRALEQRIQKIEIERQLGRVDEATTHAKLREEALRLRVDKGERSAATHVLAFLGILQKFLAQEEVDPFVQRAQHEKLAGELLAALAPETAIVDWAKKEDVQREMRRKTKRLLRAARCPQNLQETLTAELMKIARARLA